MIYSSSDTQSWEVDIIIIILKMEKLGLHGLSDLFSVKELQSAKDMIQPQVLKQINIKCYLCL
jgi:hypothetical protein